MKNDDRSQIQALANALADLSVLFRSASDPRRSQHDSAQAPFKHNGDCENANDSIIDKINVLIHETAAQYQKLEHEAQSLAGSNIALSQIIPMLRRHALSTREPETIPAASMAAMVSLFGRASATLQTAVVQLAARLEAGTIAIYEPYERTFHPSSSRTSIGTISDDWVRKESDGIDGTPDIYLDLEYIHQHPAPQVIIEITWVGSETVNASGGTSWTSTRLTDGGTIRSTLRSLAMTPMQGIVKIPLTISALPATPVRYDIWIRTTASAKPGPAEDDDDGPIIIAPTPIPVPVPSPTPTGIPTDIFAALDPDRWRRIEDRLGQFVRETIGAFEGILPRVDILTDRTVLRDVSAALRERFGG